mmetsp:Transcript_14515/g.31130  ORF Transcript_14515/g.31130 Transcript_14515/m.31130 type:complete len:454 (-) Transcript_14515:313-1674(-)
MAMVIEDAMGNSGHIQSSTSTSQVFSNARTALVALLCLLVGFLLGSTCHGELVFEDKERGTRSEWHSARTLEHVHQRRLGQNRNLQHKTGGNLEWLTSVLHLDDSFLSQLQAETSVELIVAAQLLSGPPQKLYPSESLWVELYLHLQKLLFKVGHLPITLSERGCHQGWGRPHPSMQEAAKYNGLTQVTELGRNDASSLNRLFMLRFLEQQMQAFALNVSVSSQSQGGKPRCLTWDSSLYTDQFPGCGSTVVWKFLPSKASGSTFDGNVLQADIISDVVGELPQLREYFDIIVCTEVFEHVRRPHVAAQTLAGLLHPNGIVIWTAPFLTRFHGAPTDYYRFTVHGAIATFEDAGFDILAASRGGNSELAIGALLGMGNADFDHSTLLQNALLPVNLDELHLATTPNTWLYVACGLVARKRPQSKADKYVHTPEHVSRSLAFFSKSRQRRPQVL